MKLSEGSHLVHYNSEVEGLYGGVVLGQHLQVCPDGFFMEVEIISAVTTEALTVRSLSIGVTTRNALQTKFMPPKICELMPSWIVECPAFQSTGVHRIALLVTWGRDLIVFCDGELLPLNEMMKVPTTTELFGILDLGPHIRCARVVGEVVAPRLPDNFAQGASRHTLVTRVVFSAEITDAVVNLARHSGTTVVSVLLTCWFTVMMETGWPADTIAVPWSERPMEERHSSIGNHIRMLVLKGSLLRSRDMGDDMLVLPFEEALVKIDSALRASAQESLACLADSTLSEIYDSVVAWELESGGWLEAAAAISRNSEILHVPQDAYPSTTSTLSLCCSCTGQITGSLSVNSNQDQILSAQVIVQELQATCLRHAARSQL